MAKTKSITLQNEIDPKTGLVLIKDYNSYNSIKFYLQKDEEKPNIKYVIYGRVKSRCVKKIAIGITPVAFLNLFFPNSTSQKKNK